MCRLMALQRSGFGSSGEQADSVPAGRRSPSGNSFHQFKSWFCYSDHNDVMILDEHVACGGPGHVTSIRQICGKRRHFKSTQAAPRLTSSLRACTTWGHTAVKHHAWLCTTHEQKEAATQQQQQLNNTAGSAVGVASLFPAGQS